jgi:hypothetical protein
MRTSLGVIAENVRVDLSFGARFDLDHSAVTIVRDHDGGTVHWPVDVTSNLIEWYEPGQSCGHTRVNRITGALSHTNECSGARSVGSFSKADGF